MVNVYEDILGGAGYWQTVVRLAVARGHCVVNVDALTYAGNLANVARVMDWPNYAFEQWIFVTVKNWTDCSLSMPQMW